ncbi:MAG TPA: hypothetical protein VF424_06750, partial [Vicinamibacterales bacterium]
RVLPERSTLVAEGGLVDRSIVGQSRGAASGAWRRVPQDVSAIRALWESGATVVGFARARANLEELGVRFRPVLNAGVPMPLDEFLETIPEGWIVAAATSDRFRSDGREPDASFRALGGGPRLPDGESGRYGVIAVKAHRDQTLRQAGPTAVDLGLAAGDALGDSTRAPVAIRVSSGEAGAFVEVGGARVAETRTGVAVAVIAPTGELAGAFSAEAGEDLLVNPSGLAPAYVDVEPCANLPPDQWVDVSEVVGGGSIGAILEDDQTLVLYFGSRYPFDPRLEPLNHASVPDVVVTSYPAAGAGETVQAALARDEAAPALGDWPHVSRVEIQSPAGGRSQMALRLGGFVQAAQARVTAPDPSSDVSVCSAGGSGAEPIDAAGELADADIDLGADDLFVFGWDSLERTGGRLFRWSLLRTAGLLVPLAVPVDLRIEITATAAGSGMLKLHINDTELPPVALQAGEQVYRWTVSGKAWRRGLNRVLVQVPDLVRAVDLGAAGDDRLLGLSVSRIRLVRVNQAR